MCLFIAFLFVLAFCIKMCIEQQTCFQKKSLRKKRRSNLLNDPEDQQKLVIDKQKAILLLDKYSKSHGNKSRR